VIPELWGLQEKTAKPAGDPDRAIMCPQNIGVAEFVAVYKVMGDVHEQLVRETQHGHVSIPDSESMAWHHLTRRRGVSSVALQLDDGDHSRS
jgi:hypothetical protein